MLMVDMVRVMQEPIPVQMHLGWGTVIGGVVLALLGVGLSWAMRSWRRRRQEGYRATEE